MIWLTKARCVSKQKDNLNDAVEAGKQAYREKVEPKVSETLA